MSVLAIEHINEFDTLNAGREKINKHAIDPANRAELNSIDAKTVANQANQTSQNAEAIAVNTDDRLDNIIAGEMQDAEVIDARRPFGGEAYPTLGERLDDEKLSTSRELKRMRYDVVSEGAVGDGVTDNKDVFKALLSKLRKGDTIYFPFGNFRTIETLLIDKPINIIMDGFLIIDHANTGILFKDSSSNGSFSGDYHDNIFISGNIKLKRVKNKGYELIESAIGVDFFNVFSSRVNLDVITNNYIGVRYYAEKYGTGYAGTSYCTSFIGLLHNYKINIQLKAKGTAWVSQNQFYSGSVTGTSNESLESIHVDIANEGTSVINENTFFGISFEGGFKKAIKSRKSSSNKFISCRYEMPNLTHLFDFESSFTNEFICSTYVGDALYANKFNDNSLTPTIRTDTKVIYVDYRLGSIEYYDRIFYIKPQKTTTSSANTNGVLYSRIPDNWEVRILTEGFSENTINSNSTNTNSEIITVNLKNSNMLRVYESSAQFNRIKFSNPPSFSCNLMVAIVVSGGKPITLSVDETISSIIDKTSLGLETPRGVSFVELFYDCLTKRLYAVKYI